MGYRNQQYQFLTTTQAPTAANDYTLKYRMRTELPDTFKDFLDNASRWQMQFGIKYFF